MVRSMTSFKDVGRNDPCPCGSTKKFKRCHGETATAWVGNAPKQDQNDDSSESGESTAASQFDPSKMDLNWLAQFSGAIQKLPKGQLQRLQSLMQKAMAGKDVARELEEFQRTLPVSVQELLKKSPELESQLEAAKLDSDQTASTELTDEQKMQLAQIQKSNQKTGLSKLWNKFKGTTAK
jgi:hypothetical protein